MRLRLRFRLPNALALAACVVASATASREARADDAAARLFDEGRALMIAGRFDEACPKLAESQTRDPHVGTLLNLAACHEKQGRVGTAWVEYQKVLTAAKAEGQAARGNLAEARIAALDPVVPWLSVVPAAAAGDIEITLDGGAVAREAFGKEMPVDPGEHVVTARCAGGLPRGEPLFRASLTLASSEHREVRVTLEGDGCAAAPTAAPDVRPETVVVESVPPLAPRPRPPAPAKLSRWVFEPGLYLGLVGIDSTSPRLEENVQTQNRAASNDTQSCASSCALALDPITTVSTGVSGFVGYAATDSVRVGLRGMLGPNLLRSGGATFGVGPSISMAVHEGLRIGLWGVFGDADARGRGTAIPYDGYRYELTRGGPFEMRTALNGGIGLGLEVGVDLARIGSGALVANATPFYVSASNGSFWALPVGLAYRFE